MIPIYSTTVLYDILDKLWLADIIGIDFLI